MNNTDYDTFQTHFNAGYTQLIWQELPADLDTPVSAYLKVCGDVLYSFLLESVEGGNALGRYSIIGTKPDKIWRTDEISTDNVLGDLRQTLKDCAIDKSPDTLPPMAVSGLFGYMGYDMIRHVENIPTSNPDDLNLPESILIRPTLLLVFDHVKSMITLITPVYTHANNSELSAQRIWDAHTQKLKAAAEALHEEIDPALTSERSNLNPKERTVTSSTPKDTYIKAIEKTKDYILEGDIFQAVIAQRFSCDFDLPSFELYRSLRRLNPSPFLFHMNFDTFSLVGSSPEILVRLRDNTVTIRPIAGTRPRGKTPAEDEALANELLGDKKERAEHLMLLDLGRNDVGKISDFGSVTVTDQFMIEKYSHVMHIVSNVEGQLNKDHDQLDALFAGFPAGTVSGAPKIRAMEIIDELEISKRGPYGGAIGYLSANGDLDTCIALRTGLIKDGKLYVQAGGGIVADSDPEFEYQESVNKSQALFSAASQAIAKASRS